MSKHISIALTNDRRTTLNTLIHSGSAQEPLPPQVPRKITGEVDPPLNALACSAPPEGQQRWTLQLLAEHFATFRLVDRISHAVVRTV